jgi:hypothetical protein
MIEIEPAMWLFLQKPEIGITNNEAERVLPHAVLWRRVSFGSQSEAGAETVVRLLRVVMRLVRREEIAHKHLVEVCRARHEGRAACQHHYQYPIPKNALLRLNGYLSMTGSGHTLNWSPIIDVMCYML